MLHYTEYYLFLWLPNALSVDAQGFIFVVLLLGIWRWVNATIVNSGIQVEYQPNQGKKNIHFLNQQ